MIYLPLNPDDDRFGCKYRNEMFGSRIQEQITAFNQPRMMHMHPSIAAAGTNQNPYISIS